MEQNLEQIVIYRVIKQGEYMKEIIDLFFVFAKMGAVTFGGGYAMLPILRKEIVEKRKWLSEEEVMDFYAISQGLPGIIAINVSVFIGYARKKGVGAISSALGMVTPSVIIITIIAMCLSNFQDNLYVGYALSGISVCVSVLIIDSVMAMWKKGVKDIFGIMLFLIMLICMVFTNISPILLVILSAMSGIIYMNKVGGKA